MVIDDIKTTVYETQSIYTISAIITQYRPQKIRISIRKRTIRILTTGCVRLSQKLGGGSTVDCFYLI